MAYTSEQYKYLLIQHLRRHLSMKNDADRIYTQNFFGHLFDETVTVTEASYNQFIALMDYEIQFCADNNIYYCDSITQTMIDEHGLLLIAAFEAVGIGLVIEKAYASNGTTQIGGNAIFTKPNGEVMIYPVRDSFMSTGQNMFQICAHARTEYTYAQASARYYNFKDTVPPSLADYNPFRAGPNTFWTYDADTKVMTITGDGFYVTAPRDPQLGGGPYEAIIFGASVRGIKSNALKDYSLRALVFWHAADVEVLLEDSIAGTASASLTLDIYCDNEMVRAYTGWPSGYNIRWHSISEWAGMGGLPDPDCLYYNGTLLPKFTSNLEYIVIGSCSDGRYMAMDSSSPKKLAEGKTTLSPGLFTACWLHTPGTYVWTKSSSGYNRPAMTPIWANYDVLNADGSVFLKASEPTTTPPES